MVNEYQNRGQEQQSIFEELVFFGHDYLQYRCHTGPWGFEGNNPVFIDSLAIDDNISWRPKAGITMLQ